MLSVSPVWNCYVLVIELRDPCSVVVSGERVVLDSGVYLYVGSAMGAGGALSRIARHLSVEKKIWWHIDRLLACPSSTVRGVFLVRAENCDCEVEVSRVFREELGGIPGFGSSNKRQNYTHLYTCKEVVECASRVYNLLENVKCIVDIVYAEN